MLKKTVVNLFLISWFAILLIDAAPHVSDWHGQLDKSLDRYLDATGLWQGGWQLFAPEPDKINVAIQADVEFSDGSTVVWHSPEWRSLSAVERFLRFREAEFVDSVQTEANYSAWSTYAQYLARTIQHPDNPDAVPKTIVLTRHWVNIPNPNSFTVSQFPEPLEFEKSFVMFADDVRQADPVQAAQ